MENIFSNISPQTQGGTIWKVKFVKNMKNKRKKK
jgi:hypothetical protein